MDNLYISIIVIVLIIYIYIIQFRKNKHKTVHLDELLKSNILKTGDVILFKAHNNYNSIAICSYYTHTGIIYVDNNIPYLFEAANPTNMHLKRQHSNKGIYLTRLKDRLEKYKGYIYLKPLERKIDIKYDINFKKFIDFTLNNMSYQDNVIKDSLFKFFHIGDYKTINCGELVYYSLIKLGLIELKEYNKSIINHCKYISKITDLTNNRFLPLIEIVDHPFES